MPSPSSPFSSSQSRSTSPILPIRKPGSIHPTAVVSAKARLGSGVSIGPFCVIDDDVEIGEGCQFGPHATILRFTTLGPACRVHSNAVLGDLPQDQRYRDAISHVRIGAGCVIREGVTVHRGTEPDSVTVVGDGSLLMANSHVGHNAHVGRNVTLANGTLLGGHSEIGDYAFLSGNCLVHQFTRVGMLAMMSGGSAAQRDVPPFCMTRSLSANTVACLNVVGLRRSGMPSHERAKLKRAFDILYRSGTSVSAAVESIEGEIDTPSTRELCRFLRSAKRGICKFFRDEPRRDESEESLAA